MIDRNSIITFKAYFPEGEKVYNVTGRKAQTLWALSCAKNSGITALEMANSWALRLASYIYDLRHDNGIEIQTNFEPHDGGEHARYVLISEIEILEITTNK